MAAKTERITLLGTPKFKNYLGSEAEKEGVSVSELVRSRCTQSIGNSDDIILLQSLIEQVNDSTKKAEISLTKGLSVAGKVLSKLKEARG